MIKTLKKESFGYKDLLELQTNDCIIVVCDSLEDFNSVKSTCYQVKVRQADHLPEGWNGYTCKCDYNTKTVAITAK